MGLFLMVYWLWTDKKDHMNEQRNDRLNGWIVGHTSHSKPFAGPRKHLLCPYRPWWATCARDTPQSSMGCSGCSSTTSLQDRENVRQKEKIGGKKVREPAVRLRFQRSCWQTLTGALTSLEKTGSSNGTTSHQRHCTGVKPLCMHRVNKGRFG